MMRRMSPSMREAMIDDEPFRREFNYFVSPTVELGHIKIDRSVLFNSIRASFGSDLEQSVLDIEGETQKCLIENDDEAGVRVTIAGKKFVFEAAQVLSADRELRLSAMSRELAAWRIGALRAEHWNAIAASAGLTDDEFIEFLTDLDNSPKRELIRIGREFSTGMLDVFSAIPRAPEAWHPIVAALQESTTWSAFASNELLSERRAQLQRGLREGLCLIGPSFVLECPKFTATLSTCTDEELIAAVDDLLVQSDPFSLAFALDIAALRAGDDRFVCLGVKVLDRLFDSKDSDRLFQDYSAAIKLTLGAFSDYEHSRSVPLFYARQLAWTWAGHLARELAAFQYDRQQFLSALNDGPGFRSFWTCVVQRQQFPFWRGEWLNPEDMTGLLLRRALRVCERLGESSPSQWLSKITESRAAQGGTKSSTHCFMPGPLDQASENWNGLRECTGEIVEKFRVLANAEDPDEFFARIFVVAATTKLPEDLMEIVEKVFDNLCARPEAGCDLLRTFQTMGHLVGVTRRTALAEKVAAFAVSRVAANGGKDSISALYHILDASSAFTIETERTEFVKRHIERLAFEAQDSGEGRQCAGILEMLSTASKTLKPSLSRARATFRLVD